MPGPGRGLAGRSARAAARPAGHAELGQWRRACASSARSRSTTPTCSPSPSGSRTAATQPVDAVPLRPGQPVGHAADAGLLHPARGPDRRAGRQARGDRLRRSAGGRRRRAAEPGRLARHHRQVLADGAGPRSAERAQRHLPRTIRSTARTATRSTICATPITVPAGGSDRGHRAPVRRRQGGRAARPLQRAISASRCSTARSISAGSIS